MKNIEYGIKEVKVFQHGNGTSVVIRPDLPEEEYQRRHKELERAAANVLKCVERNRQGNKLEDKGKDKIVTPEGDVVSCISGVNVDEADGYGYISHFATCPNAQKHRKKA